MQYSHDIQTLIEALELSPDNLRLRYFLAEKFLNSGYIDEAETHLQELLKRDRSNLSAKELLAEAFYKKKKYAAIIMIVEEIQDTDGLPFKLKLYYTKALVKDGNMAEAQKNYADILAANPNFSDKELDDALRIKGFDILDELEESDSVFLEVSDINFSNVGGLENVKKEINMKIIKPLENPELFKKFGKKIGGGILLYGPPGCGKTYIARATAGQINAKFINVTISDILDMYIGQSERNLAEVFEVARENKPCVIFFDEVDALGANRHSMKSSAAKHVINQFLAEMDGINTNNEGLLIVGATNTPWALDNAFRRPGRFDRIIFVPPPDEDARKIIFELELRDKPIESIDYYKLAKQTHKYSGADIKAVVDIAIEQKLEESMESGELSEIKTKDLLAAVKKHKPTTIEWFNTAKNYALYANQSGLYDEILKYL